MADLLSMLGSRRSQKVRTTVKHVEAQDGDTWMINEYRVLGVLGAGSTGEVLKMRKRTGVKKFGKKRDDGQLSPAIMREIAVMKKMQHSNMLRLYEVIINPTDDLLFLVMELCENGQLLDWDCDRAVFTCRRALPGMRRVVRDCVKALHFMHLQNIYHRDIKPENILFDVSDVAKFADFGLSLTGDGKVDDFVTDIQGTEAFYPPEYVHALKGDGIWKFKGKAADIWALGVTFYAFAFKQHPFFSASDDRDTMLQRICTEQVSFPSGADVDFMRLISRMLAKAPSERITIDEIINHPFVNEDEQPLSYEIKDEIVRVSKEEVQTCYSVYSIQLAHRFIKKMRTRIAKEEDVPVRDKKEEQPQRLERIHSVYNHFKEHKLTLIHRPDFFDSVKVELRGPHSSNLFVRRENLPQEGLTDLLVNSLVLNQGEAWLEGL
ncbi:calcium/calmodulin-dependent protein kinase kinase 1-like [Hippocampus zosterae]|uniref:calcium/calmodulin-dependent protein kinase kinase 1-like n=1 Tax=Hippocampus zosterae TaxID=109293 RepID=UPI00223DCAF4|nr:calcium/calmodulin-dependent protein kinase kinase 1-like [Hippocampus zosterae]